jgi:hypothetical protein
VKTIPNILLPQIVLYVVIISVEDVSLLRTLLLTRDGKDPQFTFAANASKEGIVLQ